jgi:p-hydroxybenzoate 3-monooxygenase
VESRTRAGVLEQGTVELFRELGLAGRLDREGLVHHGIEIRYQGVGHRIAMKDLTGGRTITVYGQQEVVKDLVASWAMLDGDLFFGAEALSLAGLQSNEPVVRYRYQGEERELRCDIVAGCDGFHGISRQAIPQGSLSEYIQNYPFGWVGILAQVAPSTKELIYARHERGFALHSLRSTELSRLYVQCEPNDVIENWPDRRIWNEMHARFAIDGWSLSEGPILEKSITPMRSYVAEPMQYGRLYLTGDAAHIVPPTGAKGLNLAVADVRVLAHGLREFFTSNTTLALNRYSEICLRRVWKVMHFSWWMTSMLHNFPGDEDGVQGRLQLAQLDYVTSSRAASESLAEQYVGLPFEAL